MLSRLFRSGNSQALRIPKELAFPGDLRDVQIERQGDMLIVRPVAQRNLAAALQAFAAFPPDFLAEGRPEGAELERLF